MRRLEWIWFISQLGTALYVDFSDSIRFSLLLGLSVIHLGVFEAFRWQLVPSHLAMLFYLIPVSDGSLRLVRSSLQFILAVISFVLCFIMPVITPRKPHGPFHVATTQLWVTDHSRPEWTLYDFKKYYGGAGYSVSADTRRRPVLLRFWYPADSHVIRSDTQKPSKYLPFIWERGSHFASQVGLPAFIVSHLDLITAHASESATEDSLFPLPPGESKYPVLFYSHGYCSSSDLHAILHEITASFGVIVVAIDHSFDAAASYDPRNQNLLVFDADVPSEFQKEDFWQFRGHHLDIRTEDVQFAADVVEKLNSGIFVDTQSRQESLEGEQLRKLECLEHIFKGRIDTEKFAVSGHSFGGGTSINTCFRDRRFKGAFVFDAWLSPLRTEIKKLGLNVPLVMVHRDRWPGTDYWLIDNDAEVDMLSERTAIGDVTSRLYRITGTTHQDFIDVPMYAPLVSQFLGVTSKYGTSMQYLLQDLFVNFLHELEFIEDSVIGEQLRDLEAIHNKHRKIPIQKRKLE